MRKEFLAIVLGLAQLSLQSVSASPTTPPASTAQTNANATQALVNILDRAAQVAYGSLDAAGLKNAIEQGADINATAKYTTGSLGGVFVYTPLFFAIREGNVDLVRYLLDKGADPNKGGTQKFRTPLSYASGKQNPNQDIVTLLVQHGAK